MAIIPTLTPLTQHLGYTVAGIDASKPLALGTQELLRGAIATRGLLVFHDQELTDEQQVEFSRIFGKISKQGPIQAISKDATYVSNVRKDGAFGDVELHFHSDQAYYEHPMKALMLYGIEVPDTGGDTLFISTAAAVNAMSEELLVRLRGMKVLNKLDYGGLKFSADLASKVQAVVPQAWHAVLTTHEASGQCIHMVNLDHSKAFEGLSEQETASLLDEIHAITMNEDMIYRHRWRKGDLLVWDNTLLHHARTPFASSSRRTLRRCAIGHELEIVSTPDGAAAAHAGE